MFTILLASSLSAPPTDPNDAPILTQSPATFDDPIASEITANPRTRTSTGSAMLQTTSFVDSGVLQIIACWNSSARSPRFRPSGTPDPASPSPSPSITNPQEEAIDSGPPPSETGSDNNNDNAKVIAPIAVVSFIVLAASVVGVVVFFRRKPAQSSESENTNPFGNGAEAGVDSAISEGYTSSEPGPLVDPRIGGKFPNSPAEGFA
jgi:hypothetical protein